MLEAWISQQRLRAFLTAAMMMVACLALLPLTVSGASAETRTLKLYNAHTHERVSITFKKNGRYLSDGLRELNRFLRDWRRNEVTKMDPKLFDLIWEVYQEAGGSKPITVVSGYRSPATNNMLRSRSRGVAKKSQHTRGKAMDFYIPGVNLAKLRAIGLRKEIGGVGFYPTSGSPFVHMDTGSVRHWPRMTRKQLARVFPRGDTIHIPTDGKKMPRYAEALARHKSGSKRARPTVVASASSSAAPVARQSGDLAERGVTRRASLSSGSSGGPSLISRLFGGDEDEEEATANAPRPPAPVRSRIAEAPVPAPAPDQAPPGVSVATAPEAESQAPVVVANVVPRGKPGDFSAVVAAATTGSVAPGTLEAQAQRIAAGLPPVEVTPRSAPGSQEAAPIVVASAAPLAKPAELRQGPLAGTRGQADGALPRPAPADAASAIAAVTGAAPSRKPQNDLGAQAALAFAPSTTSASAASGPVAVPQRRQPSAQAGATRPASVSGRLPAPVIQDPLAKFAALPDRSLPGLMSGRTTTRTIAFARLSHPNQRQLEFLLAPGGRVYANRFVSRGSDGPRPDRFEGPAVVLLPVVSFQ
uniref:DUF882 domain-containing protein n=1 Tax=Stappia sp. TaxID=1870903 RepID=UPI003BAD5CC2